MILESLRLDDQNDLADDKAGVAELKVDHDDINASAENECFFDIMCDEAAKLVSSVLCKGNLVKNVTIYGVVVAHNHR